MVMEGMTKKGAREMRYYRNYRKPQVRTITVKHAGQCVCCGSTIEAGQMADCYPVGTIASLTAPAIAHVGGMDGNSARCSAEIAKRHGGSKYLSIEQSALESMVSS